MILKFCVDEDFVNYKEASMFLGASSCTFKCDIESGKCICQNSSLRAQPVFNIPNADIVKRYLSNDLTHSIVFGGLEPLDSIDDVLEIATLLRQNSMDKIIVYTGYTEEECLALDKFKKLINLKNIVVKFGRFVPNQEPHKDNFLGVNLASNNQYAKEYL